MSRQGSGREEMAGSVNAEVEIFTLVHDVLINWWCILLGGLAAAMAAYLVVNTQYVPEYTTTTTFVVSTKDTNNTYSNLGSANTMAQTFEKILHSSVMKKVISEELGGEGVDAGISTEVLEGTNLLVLSVTADTPRKAIDTIRTIMDHYSEVSFYTMGNAVMDVLEEPKIPWSAGNPLNVREVQKKAFLGGAAVCAFLFGLLSYLRNSVKQEKEIEKKLDARSMGAISYEFKYKTIRQLIQHKKTSILVDSPIASFAFVESYKKLAARVEYRLEKDGGKVLVITSVSENEGKSTVAANLAISLADQGKRVILVDGDIRRPSQFLIFGLQMEPESEFGEFLKGEGTLKKALITGERKHLYFLAGRNCYSSSTEILQTERLPRLIRACKKYADYVIIDTPPAGLLGDAQVFAQSADAVLLVAKQNYMLAEDINDILDDFRDNHSKILGVVLNGVQTFANVADSSAGGYYGKYGRYGNYSRNRGN